MDIDPDVKHVKEREHYEIIIRLTPEQYARVLRDASWDGQSVSTYLVNCATGNQRRGC